MGQIQWGLAFVFIACFTFAVLSFAIGFANDNSSPIDISDDTQLSLLYPNTSSNLSTYNTESATSSQSILNTTIAPGSQTAQSSGPFTITFANAIGVVTNIMGVGYQKIFGSTDGFGIFLSVFIGVIGLITALYIWKALFGGVD